MTSDQLFDSAPLASAPVNVQNGTFTVEHPQHGHFTLKLHTAQRGSLEGRRIVSLLVGPSNTTDFTGVGFWLDEPCEVDVWTRFRSDGVPKRLDGYHWGERWSALEKKLAIWCDLAVRGSTEAKHGAAWNLGYRLLHERRCVRCNQPLTHPESIATGIGPECAKRQGR